MERDLLTGERQALLEDYFGEESYRDLVDLAREPAPRRTRGGARVLILPGFLGSTLGKNRVGPFDDVLWFDPIDIFNGRLSALALDEKPASSPWKALGAVEFTYLRLKLNLIRDGYDADFHPFDWRQSVEVSARRLLRRLASESAPLISLVAHSMGGLVLRAAMGIARKERHPALKKIRRIVTIGTPHSGSFAGVQVLRGNHGTLRKVAALDRKHDADWLASNVLSTFPGLYETLPVPEKTGPIPLYDASSWPATGPRPRQALLDRVAAVRALLAPGSDKIFVIAGVDVRTVVALHPGSGEFLYDVSNEGDGTIPVSLALLPDARTWFVKSEHGSQPNSPLIARAVAEILDRGETAALPETWKVSRAAAATKIPESEVHSSIFGATKLASAGTVRRTFEEFASPDFEPRNSMSGSVARPTFPKKSHRSVEVRVVLGDITAVSARAYALGLFQDVTPGGAARDLDEKLDGAITEMTLRRMFLGGVGQIYMLPVSRSGLLTEVITFVGLGAFDRFSEGVQEIAAENVIRALLRSNVEEVATVLIGSGSGSSVSRSLRTLMTGFLRGLNDADPEQRFRRVILCEKNPEKYQEIRNAVHQLLEQEESAGVRWTVEEQTLKERPEVVVPRSATAQPLVTGGDQPVYLIVRVERHSQREQVLRASVLTAGPKAAVITGWRPFSSTRLARLLTPISRQTFHRDSLRTIGNDLAAELLDDSVRAVLLTMRERHLVVVHDAESSRVPWEILCLGDWFPAAEAGLSHRYAAENLSVAKWLEERREDGTLSMLLVVNPTEDLSGAEAEGDRIQSIFGGKRQVRIAELRGPDATRPALISAFRSGAYDVVHYAGHAFFEPGNPSQSGLLCHGGEVLSGADLAGLAGLPTLVFFNACESGRVRGRTPGRLASRVQESAGLAEAFLRGGVANFLGTYWPVGDSAAEVFASTFYQGLLGGEMIGKTIQKSRSRVMALGKQDGRDWADYLYYGDPLFVLKKAM